MEVLLGILPAVFFAGVMGVGAIAFVVYGQKRLGQLQEQTRDYTAGAVAQRLGMEVVRGAPGQNLWITGKTALESQHLDICIAGQWAGVPVDIVYYRDVQHEKHNWTEMTVHSEWEVRIAAHTEASFGHFEVMFRRPKAHNTVTSFFRNPMPELRTGHPHVDATYRVTGDNPAIAEALGELLAPLIGLEYVHVVGAPGRVSFRLDRGAAGRGNEMMGVAYALYDAERVLNVLTAIVRTAEGRA